MTSAEAVVKAFTGLHSTKHPSVVMLVTRGGADKEIDIDINHLSFGSFMRVFGNLPFTEGGWA